MRFSLPILRRLSDALRRRDWFGIGFELFVVVVGVLLGLEASQLNARREEQAYRRQIVAALDETLKIYEGACISIHQQIGWLLAQYDRRVAAGERPPPPFIHFRDLERPPTRAWDAMVATGIARSLKPALVFELARYFSRGEGWGDRYARYNAFSEAQILPYLATPGRFYGLDGRLKPQFAAHVEQLRELLEVNDHLGSEATAMRRALRQTD